MPSGLGLMTLPSASPIPSQPSTARRASAFAKAMARSSSEAFSGTASTSGSARVVTISAVVSGRSCTRTLGEYKLPSRLTVRPSDYCAIFCIQQPLPRYRRDKSATSTADQQRPLYCDFSF